MESGAFGLQALKPMPDGGAVLYGWHWLSEIVACDGDDRSGKPYATTYEPSDAYIIHPDIAAQYSLQESRSYNQRFYVWAGRRSSEQIAVVHNAARHPALFAVPVGKVRRYVRCGK